ncbi:hypothetical protein LTR50_004681 [Elasticomyces elasticus]|nr:hypothetical protein LTR50_004681 [Elasticomyces elasticus]
MVYDWDDKKATCHKLYVEERQSLDDVMAFFKRELGFVPSKRAFQTQFRRWDFPSKQNPAHKNAPLVARIRELWESNTGQRDMLRMLRDEGFDIKERELMRVRARHRWLLRVPNGTTPGAKKVGKRKRMESGEAREGQEDGDYGRLARELDEVAAQEDANAQAIGEGGGEEQEQDETDVSYRDADMELKRKERMEQLQAESDARWQTRKRRRRTNGWAGLPADPPGPPRFPSETTLDEAKHQLSLDNDLYRRVRDHFTTICSNAGIMKKTLAGPDKWTAAKSCLVAENAHLASVFKPERGELEKKHLSLDVVCTDVTKRIRMMNRRMSIADAKNALSLNPEQSRNLRTAFYELLLANHFTSRLVTGDEHWNALRQKWIDDSTTLSAALAPGDADPEHDLKVKAVECLARDVMKRLRDDQARKDPERKKLVNPGPGPGPAKPRQGQILPASLSSLVAMPKDSFTAPTPTALSASAHRLASTPVSSEQATDEAQIDPSLLLAASADTALRASYERLPYDYSTATSYRQEPPPPPPPQPGTQHPAPIPAYFKLHPRSLLAAASFPRIWIGTLASPACSTDELQRAALAGLARSTGQVSGVHVVLVEGIAYGAGGEEIPYRIDRDEEVEGYMRHVAAVEGKATFAVVLEQVL